MLGKMFKMKGTFKNFWMFVPLAWALAHAQNTWPFEVATEVEFDRQPDLIVAAFREVNPEFAENDTTPLLRIFGDGRVLLHRSEYMKRPGLYELHLGAEELEALLADLAAALQGFEPTDVKEAVRAAEHLRWTAAADWRDFRVYHVADASISEFYLNVRSLRAPASAGKVIPLQPIQTSWQGLLIDAQLHPGVAALQDLRQAEEQLRQLARRPDFVRADGGRP